MAGAARRWSSTCTWDQLVDNRRRGGEEQLRVRGDLRGVGGVGAGVPGQHRPWHAVRVRPGAPAARGRPLSPGRTRPNLKYVQTAKHGGKRFNYTVCHMHLSIGSPCDRN